MESFLHREICNLLKLSPLTGWFVLSAREVVLTMGFVLACLIKKGQRQSAQTQVWQKLRKFCHVYLSSATQNKTLLQFSIYPIWLLCSESLRTLFTLVALITVWFWISMLRGQFSKINKCVVLNKHVVGFSNPIAIKYISWILSYN